MSGADEWTMSVVKALAVEPRRILLTAMQSGKPVHRTVLCNIIFGLGFCQHSGGVDYHISVLMAVGLIGKTSHGRYVLTDRGRRALNFMLSLEAVAEVEFMPE